MTYYKLVRPDYTSFYDEKFKWPKKGKVTVPDACPNGPCGNGLHLAKSLKSALKYAEFPFRIISVRPLSAILGEDDDKIRVAKAECLGEIPIPKWAKRTEKRIEELREEVKTIPWFKGKDVDASKRLIHTHFRLLVPFGFKLDFEIDVLSDRAEAWDAARAAVSAEASAAAWAAAWAAARVAARDAARDAARAAARDAAWAAGWAEAWDAVEDLVKQSNPFKPLWQVWKLGGWPIGFVGNKFKLYMGGLDKVK